MARVFSKEHKEKLCLAWEKRKQGFIPWNKGKKGYKSKPCSEERKEKIRAKHIGRTALWAVGSNNYHWKGGYENTLMLNRKRRVSKFNNGGSHTLEEWNQLRQKYNYMCLCCKKQEPFITLSEDHIVPLSQGGVDDISNIQPLCRSCNSQKHAKIIDYRLMVSI